MKIGFVIEKPTPFIEEFFAKIAKLKYDKAKIDLFIHNAVEFHDEDVESFLEENKSGYKEVTVINPKDGVKEWHARNKGLARCVAIKCDFYFNVDADAHMDNPMALRLLIEQNRNVVAPFLLRPYKAWSNFWGSLTAEGYYARSFDYMDIVNADRRGLWNVPFITSSYLIKGDFILDEKTRPSYIHKLLDADMAFCSNLREAGHFFYVSNRINFGHLVNSDDFSTEHLNNELWEISNNRWDWEQRYIHENYTKNFDDDANHTQPCPDVFWFPIVSERFADELVAEMENYGKWSDGTNNVSCHGFTTFFITKMPKLFRIRG